MTEIQNFYTEDVVLEIVNRLTPDPDTRKLYLEAISELDTEEIIIFTNLFTIAQQKRDVSEKFEKIVMTHMKKYLELKISHDRKGREELTRIAAANFKNDENGDDTLLDKVRQKFILSK